MKIARWHGLVIDCPDPSQLARFYESLLGEICVPDDTDRVVIGDTPDPPDIRFAWSRSISEPSTR